MRRLVLLSLLVLTGCPKELAPEGGLLLSEVRRTLTERERRLTSYHFAAESKAGDAVATHAFFFRSPNKMRGAVLHPAHFEWTFDGTRLFKLEPAEKKFHVYELKLPQDKASFFLASTFSPFVTEGFRTPLLPAKGVKATKVQHPKGPEAVELRVEAAPGVVFTYVLRWPTGDFLAKRSESGAEVSELKVDEEHCDAALKLCVPKVVTQLSGGKVELVTKLTQVELNVEVPGDDFSPRAPEGWTTETHQVVETE
jgi:outer membrane lipoprotein-sorting protein